MGQNNPAADADLGFRDMRERGSKETPGKGGSISGGLVLGNAISSILRSAWRCFYYHKFN